MANTSYTQQALAADESFRLRVKNALASVAWQVLTEPDTVESHQARAEFARGVTANLDGHAASIAPWLVTRPNLIGFATSYDFERRAVVTASGDPDIESQIATDWNLIAGL
jgi:hypothetical protein